MNRAEQLKSYFEIIDEDKRQFAFDTVDEYCELLERIESLKGLPDIEVSKSNPAKQRVTPSAKLRKEYLQSIDAKRGTLLRILYRVENSAADDLLQKLKEFE